MYTGNCTLGMVGTVCCRVTLTLTTTVLQRTLFALYPVLFSFPQILLCNPAAAKSLQSCPTLCDPIDGSPPGSPIPGILQTGGVARPSVRGQQERGGVGAPPLSSPAPGSARVLLWGPGRAFLLPLYGGRCLCFMRGVLASIHPPKTPPPRMEVGLNQVGAAGSGRSAWRWGLV